MRCLLDSKVETLDRILNMNMNLRKIKIGNYHHANKYTAIISERRVFSITTCIQISKGFTAWCAQKPILWHWPLRKEKAYWKTDWQGDRRRGSNPSPWWCIISGYLRVRVLKWWRKKTAIGYKIQGSAVKSLYIGTGRLHASSRIICANLGVGIKPVGNLGLW